MENYHIKKILVPTDLSELSQPALKYVLFLAEPADAYVEVLHVLNTYSEAVFGAQSVNGNAENSDLDIFLAKERMLDLSNKNLGDAIKPIIHTEIGFINDVIIETAIKSKSDLIVVGYYNDLDGSSMSYRIMNIIYKSPCPVLAVQPEMTEPQYKNIIVPLRDREGMLDKMQYVVGLAKNFGSKVHLIPFYTNSKTPVAKKRMNDLVDSVYALLQAEDIEYTSMIVISGKYVTKTLEIAEKQDGDIVVILAEQSGFFQKLFGSADEENFLRLSRLPILTTPLDQHLRRLPTRITAQLPLPSHLTVAVNSLHQVAM